MTWGIMLFLGLRRSLAGCVLILALLLSALVVFHRDIDRAYNPSCPACQPANNPGSDTCIVSAAALIPSPVVLSFLPDRCETAIPQIHRTLEFIPRSPPAVVCL